MRAAVIVAYLLLTQLAWADCDCRERQLACEARCAEDNPVGSVAHLRCNDRCREDYLLCLK